MKDFITFQNILFVYDCLEEEWEALTTLLKQQALTTLLYNEQMLIRLTGTYSKNALKTNFKKIKLSEIKTIVTNNFLDKYLYKVIIKNT